MTQIAIKDQEQVALVPANNAVTPMDMLDRALAQGAGPETLAKFMDLHERWEAGQRRKAFDSAMAAAKAAIPPIVRNREGHNKKMYADFSAIAKVVDPILSAHGLHYRFRTTQADRISVTCIVSHRDGHAEESTLIGPTDKTGNKNDIQAIGSTLTYLQRYSLVQALGLSVADDDDGRAGGIGETITQEQADEIRELLEANGKDRAKFLRWAKVEKIEDIPATAYQACIDAANYKAPQS